MNLTFGERYVLDIKDPPRPISEPSLPVGDWPFWFSVANKSAALKAPRERFLMSVARLTYGLGVPHRVAMPLPHF
jgi:hypothetical protein